jgi:hypothetical protein
MEAQLSYKMITPTEAMTDRVMLSIVPSLTVHTPRPYISQVDPTF